MSAGEAAAQMGAEHVAVKAVADLSDTIRLYDTATPKNVANFLNYVNNNRYNATFIHRSLPGFILGRLSVVRPGACLFNGRTGERAVRSGA
jgi:hypothetical protein